jgi:hypothetical protein
MYIFLGRKMEKTDKLLLNIEPRVTTQDSFVLQFLLKKFFPWNGCAVEIGSFLGNGSTKTIIEAIKDTRGTLYCVDTWKGSPNVAWHRQLAEDHDLFATFRYHTALCGGEDIVKPMMMESKDAAMIFRDQTCDFIFIDGDHSFEATLQDIERWKPKVKRGGILCGHDCEGAMSDFDPVMIEGNLKEDFVSLEHFVFSGCHPGVVKAVGSIAENVTLWAHKDLTEYEISGRSSIWHLVL